MAMSRIDSINELIIEGQTARTTDLKPGGSGFPPYLSGLKYDTWMNKIKIFALKECLDHTLYQDIMDTYNSRKTSFGFTTYDNMMSYLNALKSDSDFIMEQSTQDSITNASHQTREKMIFISHSSADIDYVQSLVELLEDIGFKGKSILFCSSVDGYGIPTGNNIYDHLKEQFSKNLHVIYLLSQNYYKSIPCLNEMGATWVTSKNHTAILTPDFNYSQIGGAVDASKIWFKMDDKHRISEFKEHLISEFELEPLESPVWERKRDQYLDEVRSTYESNKHKSSPLKVEFEGIEEATPDLYDDGYDFKCIFRFINNTPQVQKCSYLDLTIIDENSNKMNLTLTANELKHEKVYPNENRRVEVYINDEHYKIETKFNIYLYEKSIINKNKWTSNI